MGAGKTFITNLIIDKHFKNSQILIIVGLRSVILQYADYFEESDYTWIVSGKNYDQTKRIVFATYQTLQNRKQIDLSSFDVVIFDEAHQRNKTNIAKHIKTQIKTIIGMTGTPLNQNNTLLTDWDNWIFGPNMTEMINNNWLSNTRFFSFSDAIESKELKLQQGDFTEESIRSLMNKEGIINNIAYYIRHHQLNLTTKTIVYLNFIEEVTSLTAILSDLPNIFPIHSKMTNTDKLVYNFKHNVTVGIAISVRSLSVGVDIPDINRVILGTLSNIHSLLLQVMWRGSRYLPNKVTEVLDFTGVLNVVDPYIDFKYMNDTKNCLDLCQEKYEAENFKLELCLKDCHLKKVSLMVCGKTPKIVKSQSTVRSDWHLVKGTGCAEASPVYEWHFTTTKKEGSLDLYKWSTCPRCGSIFKYTTKTFLKDPNNLILTSSTERGSDDEVTILQTKGNYLAIIDSNLYKTFEYVFSDNITELIVEVTNKLRGRMFFATSNEQIQELPNIVVKPLLNEWLPHINWHDQSTQVIKAIIRDNFKQWVNTLGYKLGKVFYMMQKVNSNNEKKILTYINKVSQITKKDFAYFEKTYLGSTFIPTKQENLSILAPKHNPLLETASNYPTTSIDSTIFWEPND